MAVQQIRADTRRGGSLRPARRVRAPGEARSAPAESRILVGAVRLSAGRYRRPPDVRPSARPRHGGGSHGEWGRSDPIGRHAMLRDSDAPGRAADGIQCRSPGEGARGDPAG